MQYTIKLNDKHNTVLILNDERILKYKEIIQNFIVDFKKYIKQISKTDKKYIETQIKKQLFLYRTEVKTKKDIIFLYNFVKRISKIKNAKKEFNYKGIDFV